MFSALPYMHIIHISPLFNTIFKPIHGVRNISPYLPLPIKEAASPTVLRRQRLRMLGGCDTCPGCCAKAPGARQRGDAVVRGARIGTLIAVVSPGRPQRSLMHAVDESGALFERTVPR